MPSVRACCSTIIAPAACNLDLCGFPAASPNDADEFSVAWLNDRVAAFARSGLAEFAIEIGG